MRFAILIVLLTRLSTLADEVRITVGMNYDNSVRMMKAQGAEDVASRLEIIIPPSSDKAVRQGGYWRFRNFDAVVNVLAVNSNIVRMTFWSKGDFD